MSHHSRARVHTHTNHSCPARVHSLSLSLTHTLSIPVANPASCKCMCSPCFPLFLSGRSLALLLSPSCVTLVFLVSLFVTWGVRLPRTPRFPSHVRACGCALPARMQPLIEARCTRRMQRHACASIRLFCSDKGTQYPRAPMPNAVYAAQGCSWLPKPQSLRTIPKHLKSEPQDP